MKPLPMAIALVCALSALSPLWALDLVVDGQARSALVIPQPPLPVHQAAAEELQYHVRRASGAEPPVIREDETQDDRGSVYLGPCKRTIALGIWPRETKPNGYVIRTLGRDLRHGRQLAPRGCRLPPDRPMRAARGRRPR